MSENSHKPAVLYVKRVGKGFTVLLWCEETLTPTLCPGDRAGLLFLLSQLPCMYHCNAAALKLSLHWSEEQVQTQGLYSLVVHFLHLVRTVSKLLGESPVICQNTWLWIKSPLPLRGKEQAMHDRCCVLIFFM